MKKQFLGLRAWWGQVSSWKTNSQRQRVIYLEESASSKEGELLSKRN